MSTDFTGNANVAATTIFGPVSGITHVLLGVRVAVTQIGLAGTVTLTMRWTDPEVGARSRAFGPISLLGLNNLAEDVLDMIMADNTTATYEVTVAGLLGTPIYSVRIANGGLG